jgi:hypothetical protein
MYGGGITSGLLEEKDMLKDHGIRRRLLSSDYTEEAANKYLPKSKRKKLEDK